jgi:hypothetical protein
MIKKGSSKFEHLFRLEVLIGNLLIQGREVGLCLWKHLETTVDSPKDLNLSEVEETHPKTVERLLQGTTTPQYLPVLVKSH